jgi:tRNA(Leu) C34 or U34 (ribose-2'-O)-methylase TrmL
MTFTSESDLFFDSHLIDLISAMNINMRLVIQENKNVYIEIMINEWMKTDFRDTSLWKQFRDKFKRWTKNDFRTNVSIKNQRRLRNTLRRRDLWVLKNKKIIIAKFLYQTLQKENLIEWTKEEIQRCMMQEKFMFTVIKNLIETDFDRNLKNYFWQAKSRFRSEQSRDSSTRERSTLRRSTLKNPIISRKGQSMKKDYQEKKKQSEKRFSSSSSSSLESNQSDNRKHHYFNLRINNNRLRLFNLGTISQIRTFSNEHHKKNRSYQQNHLFWINSENLSLDQSHSNHLTINICSMNMTNSRSINLSRSMNLCSINLFRRSMNIHFLHILIIRKDLQINQSDLIRSNEKASDLIRSKEKAISNENYQS